MIDEQEFVEIFSDTENVIQALSKLQMIETIDENIIQFD